MILSPVVFLLLFNLYFVGNCGLILTGNMSSRKGLNGVCSVHEYTGSFIGQSAHFKMTSVCGHVMTLDFIGICLFVKDLIISMYDVFFRKSIKES